MTTDKEKIEALDQFLNSLTIDKVKELFSDLLMTIKERRDHIEIICNEIESKEDNQEIKNKYLPILSNEYIIFDKLACLFEVYEKSIDITALREGKQ